MVDEIQKWKFKGGTERRAAGGMLILSMNLEPSFTSPEHRIPTNELSPVRLLLLPRSHSALFRLLIPLLKV